MKKPLYIYGAGGLGREILAMVRAMNEWEPVGFFDDGRPAGTEVGGLPVMGGREKIASRAHPVSVVIAIGDPQIKRDIAKGLADSGCDFPSLVHPAAILMERETIRLGAGAIITAGCVLTTNIDVGAHVLVNLNCTIGHDVVVGDGSSIMPGVNLAGEVSVGEEVLIGSGSNVRNRVAIGNRAKVGMGSVVLQDVSPGTTVVGVPAKPLVK